MVHNLMDAGGVGQSRPNTSPLDIPCQRRQGTGPFRPQGLRLGRKLALSRRASRWFARNPLHQIWPHHLHVLDQLREPSAGSCAKEPSIGAAGYGSAAARDRSGWRQQNVTPTLGHAALTAFIAKAVVEVLALCAHRRRAQDEALVLA